MKNTVTRAPSIEEQARRNPVRQLTLACAMALMSVSAVAQQVPATPTIPATDAAKKEDAKKEEAKKAAAVETIVVTGLRGSIERSISAKKDSDSIVETISAEDIGKLPDNSIADSIARLPGLAAQRVGGRAQGINIRGLSGDFGGTILNGREQVSTGDNRAAEFDQYPSELIGGVSIFKTPHAELIGQGLSGTIDLQTRRPLTEKGRVVAANLRGERNDLGKLNADGKDQGYRFNISYIDQFLNKTLGIALGYAHIDSPSQAQRWESWGYPTLRNSTAVVLGGGKQYADSNFSKRDGFMGVVQYRPNANFESLLDLYYSRFDQTSISRGMEAGLEWGAGTPSNVVIENGRVTAATYTGLKPVLRNDVNTRDDDLVAAGWNNKLNFGDGWTAIGDLSYSRAKRNEEILETYAGAAATDTVRFTQGGDGLPRFTYGLNYADPNIIRLTDAGGWGQDGYVKYPKVKDELKSFRFTMRKDLGGAFGLLNSVSAGVNYTDREKSRNVEEFFLRLRNGPSVAIPGLLSPTSLGFVGINGIVAYDARNAMNTVYNRITNLNNRDIINKNWLVQEEVVTGFMRLDFDKDLGNGYGLRGNAGFQYAMTDQSSTGTAVTNGGAGQVPSTDGDKYNNFLPSLNLILQMPNDYLIRFGAGRALARARLDDMRANENYSVDINRVPTRWTGDGGNPRLRPYIADALDLSFEKYFGTKAYIGIAGFHKKLKSYIVRANVERDFAGLPLPANITGALIPPSTIGTFNTPINGEGGYITGVEVSASIPLNLFTDALDGFGFVASLSDTHSQVRPDPMASPIQLPGLSKRVSNVTAYYEKYGFQARASVRHRSEFLGEVTGFGADREFRNVQGERVLDYQVGYAFDAGALKGLSFLFQVNNANNEPYRENFDSAATPRIITTYGRSYLLGVNYKF